MDKKLRIVAFPKHSRNPYIDLLYESVEQNEVIVTEGTLRELCFGDHALVHYHWPEAFLIYRRARRRWNGFRKFIVEILVTKLRRKKIVWSMHNSEAHEEAGGLLPFLFRIILFWAVDGLIALSNTSYQIMIEHYPVLSRKPYLISWIGHYRSLYPDLPSRLEAKKQQGIQDEQFIVGYFGAIRHYKNVPVLVKVFKQLADRQMKLIIVGRCDDDAQKNELIELAGDDPRIDLRLSFLPEPEVPRLLRAVDLMVLPFSNTLNSSSALLALSLDIPVFVPAIGTLTEIEQVVGHSWVRTYQDVLTAEILADAIGWARTPRHESAPLDHYNWEDCGKETAEFYRFMANADADARPHG
jgi:beta-1,4-mannosyltransferase